MFDRQPHWAAQASPKYLEMAEKGRQLPAARLWQILEQVKQLRRDSVALFQDIDVIVLPSAAALPWKAEDAIRPGSTARRSARAAMPSTPAGSTRPDCRPGPALRALARRAAHRHAVGAPTAATTCCWTSAPPTGAPLGGPLARLLKKTTLPSKRDFHAKTPSAAGGHSRRRLDCLPPRTRPVLAQRTDPHRGRLPAGRWCRCAGPGGRRETGDAVEAAGRDRQQAGGFRHAGRGVRGAAGQRRQHPAAHHHQQPRPRPGGAAQALPPRARLRAGGACSGSRPTC